MSLKFELPALPYAYTALEPFIDAKTMEIHHTKHHNAYLTNLNAELEKLNLDSTTTLEQINANISKYNTAVRNNAGGFYNHNLFWEILAPATGHAHPHGELAEAINKTFGSFESFKEQFSKAALTRFGSGWAWLLVHDGQLTISSTANQDNPLMDIADVKGTPILGLDVWEHAYYLHYQNRRVEYIAAFFSIINWNKVSELYNKAK